MDDDNDFPSQNFQLVGEENTRSPQSLRSFTFPKFDIDDNLQVHLRFDGLAETEVFDIPSQSNWIDEFPSRNGEIGYSSAAVEPCSISRNINVWSEATSSESVEMLLNSVREDEMVNQHTVKEETETHAMDDHTDCRTIDALDTSSVSPDKPCNIVEPNEDVVLAQLQNAGTCETLVGEEEEKKIDKCLVDKKLHSSVKVAADTSIFDGNLPSSSKVTAKVCSVDDNFLVAEKSLYVVPMNDNAPDVIVRDDKISDSLAGSSMKDGPSEVSIDSTDIHTREFSSDRIMKEHNEIDASEKPQVLPDYEENLTKHFKIIDNFDGADVNKHDGDPKVSKYTLETCGDTLPLLNEESSNVAFRQSSDGLLESIAYPAKISKKEKRPSKEMLSSTEELHSVAVLGDADSERKSIDSADDFSMQPCAREGSAFSSEGHVRDANRYQTLPTNTFEMVSLGNEKGQTPLKSLADKEEKKTGLSDNNCDDVMDIGTSPLDSSRLESSVVQKGGDDCSEDIIRTYAKSETAEHIINTSVLLADAENIAAICEKRVQMSETIISSTDANKVTEVLGKPLTLTNDYSKETVDSYNNESSATFSIATLSSYKLMDSLNEPNDGKPGGASSSSPLSLNVLQQVRSDDVLHIDAEQKEVAVSPSLATGWHKKDADISPPSVASSILNSKTTSQPLAMSDAAVAGSPLILPVGSGDAFNNFVDTSAQSSLLGNEIMSDTLDPENSKLGTSEPACDSLKAISSNDHSENVENQEGGRGLSDPSLPASGTSVGVVSDTSSKSTLPRNEVVFDTLNPENSKPGTSEPTCGSPTVISSNDKSEKVEYQEGGRGLTNPPLPASETTSIGVLSDTSPQSTLPRNEVVVDTLYPGNSKQGTSELTCGSVTVINSSDNSEKVEYQEGGKGLSDPPLPASEATSTGVVFDTSTQSTLLRNEIVGALNPENTKPGISDPTCGSPTVISSNVNSEEVEFQEGGGGPSDPPLPASETTSIGVVFDTSTQSPFPGKENVSDTLDHGNSEPGTYEPTCGSPTVISSNDNSEKVEYQEGDRGLGDPTLPSFGTTIIGETERSNDTKERKTSDDDGSFTFEVQPLADTSPKDTGSNWKPFSKMQPDEQSQVSRENQNESKDGSKQVNIISNVEEVKRNLACGRASKKGGTPRGDGKEKVQQKRPRGKEKTPNNTSTVSDKNTKRKSRTEDVKQYPFIENSITKSPMTPTIQTSNLPDLNSISSTVLLQQPFTDLQQIQLRAQIFVYGSLIQGLPPDEACMTSAFGGTDGGKSLWEGLWRTSLERFQNQKSPLYHSDTPLHTRSVAEQGSTFSTHQPKALNSPSGWSGSKIASSAALSSPISYTTPVWSVSSHDGLPSNILRGTQLEFNQAVSPLHQYPSSAIRQYANTSTPWLSQSPRSSPWVFAGSTADAILQHSSVPASDAGKGTLSSSSVSRISNIQVAPATASLPGQGVLGVSAISGATVETPKVKANTKADSGSQKYRKRKKTTPEELGLVLPISETVVEPASLSAVTKFLPSSTGFPLSVNSPSTITSSLAASAPHPVSPSYFQVGGPSDMQQRAIVLEETSTHNKQSKLQAENAAAHAASAVRCCQSIWDQLVTRQKAGLTSDIKNKLVSAAAAAAAAASVAKAAAEAAKVASEAALQAKMTADEALSPVGTGSSNQNTEIGLDSGNNVARPTVISVGKGKDNDNDKLQGSSSIISSAREAARRRVEAASAATKRAENLDAIVKAAELAAEAVSHAGTIISMGDPLPFSVLELVETGPDGYWKLHRLSHGNDAVKNDVRIDKNLSLDVDGDHDGSANQGRQVTDAGGMTSKDEVTVHSEEKNDGSKPGKASKLGSVIKKGSLVEVAANEEGLRGVWFSAWVLDVKDGKAHVCYKDLLDEGNGQLKEWIPLNYDSETAPRIRNAHPSTVARSDGTRKRQRDAVVNYIWAVGDKVDAWQREGWWEGIVMEISEGDETKLTVHFPAGGESSVVRAWNLRPSLVWRDGQWAEWSLDRDQPYKGDTPNKKRQKRGQFESEISTEVGGKNSYNDDSGKLEESRQLNLSDKDKLFAIGRSTKDDDLNNPIKVKRIGLQKEGSKVVFGIPKPGKKRKFMEVSKHYTADKTTNKVLERNESMKFTQYLMPQSSSLQKNTSKVDGKGKRTFDYKAKGLKSLRSQNNLSKTTSEKDNSESSRGPQNIRKFSSNEERTLEKNSLIHGTLTNVPEKSEFAVIESSAQPVSQVQLPKTKSSGNVEGETVHRKYALSSVDKSSRSDVRITENPVKPSADVTEPRRSNRKIQPTSRMLEGLQSSLTISKIPSFSYDKGNRTSHRGATSSRGHNR